jgi:hypothetical protein
VSGPAVRTAEGCGSTRDFINPGMGLDEWPRLRAGRGDIPICGPMTPFMSFLALDLVAAVAAGVSRCTALACATLGASFSRFASTRLRDATPNPPTRSERF